jgi:hypothetical protein
MNTLQNKAATGQEIRNILGPVDDEMVAAILRTGASSGEMLEAFEWLNDDDYMGTQLQRPMNDNVRRVCELLESDRDRFAPYER